MENEIDYCDICEAEINSTEYDENNGLCNACRTKKEKDNLLTLSEIQQTMDLLTRIIDYKNATPKVKKSIMVISNFLMEDLFSRNDEFLNKLEQLKGE
ncbi:hypothetical protein [Clostridium paraputrificum]|uniref:hypothetical protein n=1 Tax=Clostridium paraputrificum TaxID=29363 RepID=UPI00189F35C8|nr:hypothetical protein [Clostridium paraputrificum]